MPSITSEDSKIFSFDNALGLYGGGGGRDWEGREWVGQRGNGDGHSCDLGYEGEVRGRN